MCSPVVHSMLIRSLNPRLPATASSCTQGCLQTTLSHGFWTSYVLSILSLGLLGASLSPVRLFFLLYFSLTLLLQINWFLSTFFPAFLQCYFLHYLLGLSQLNPYLSVSFFFFLLPVPWCLLKGCVTAFTITQLCLFWCKLPFCILVFSKHSLFFLFSRGLICVYRLMCSPNILSVSSVT